MNFTAFDIPFLSALEKHLAYELVPNVLELK